MAEPSKRPKSPVPSFTLQMTKHDAERFLEACHSLEMSLQQKGSSLASGDTRNGEARGLNSFTKQPLHEMLYDAAQHCPHPLVVSFLERVRSYGIPLEEAKLAFLLFHDEDKTAKLRNIFCELSYDKVNHLLGRSELVSLFRLVLLSLYCCVHTPEHAKAVVVECKPGSAFPSERPVKRIKLEEDTDTTKSLSEDQAPEIQDACQSASFDSSLGTLRDEDEKDSVMGNLRREIGEISTFAAEEVFLFAKKQNLNSDKVDLATFGEWYNNTGRTLLPWLELLQLSKWKRSENSDEEKSKESEESPSSLMTEDSDSRAVLSFDFSDQESSRPIVIHISEDSLIALKHLVQRTGLIDRPAIDICKILLKFSPQRKTLTREVFLREYVRLIPANVYATLSETEKITFREAFLEYFAVFEGASDSLHPTEVDLKELALGFCLFCSGNKSAKLSLGFDILDTGHTGYLTKNQLLRYVQAYLSMLVATSLLVPASKPQTHRYVTPERRKLLHAAVHKGARWTIGHFVKATARPDYRYSFDMFANWYSVTGYNIAPWLELLDLTKVFPLISESVSPLRLPPLKQVQTTARKPAPRDRVSSLRRHHSARGRGPPPEILFTFPLANRRSLVVLKDDATYVRDVVEQLGVLSVRPEQLWNALASTVKKHRKKGKKQTDAPEYVDMQTFVRCVQEVCPKLSRKRSNPGESNPILSSRTEELLSNFFQCFDLNQTDKVAVDELMGGLSLLCGGKKSQKLSFAFSIFDTRPGAHDKRKKNQFVHSLSGEDLFLFLRSILIVTFSCCRQSLDMSDEQVGRCIADTANMICNDVMRYQWEMKQLDRLDFDEFGQWYNDGGFERAPWLELLDLQKWVLVDNFETLEKKVASTTNQVDSKRSTMRVQEDHAVPPPPPEDALDTSFFDENAIMPMDSMDEMDMILMQPSMDKDDIASPKLSKSYSFPSPRPRQESRRGNALKFHLMTHDKQGGYMLSISTARIAHLRRIILESGIHFLDAETVCNQLLAKASRSKISKQSFDLAMRKLIPSLVKNANSPDMKVFSNVLSGIFSSFDPAATGRARAIEVACGLAVLCRGKKSDKLEFAFEVLDRNKRGQLSRSDVANYLQSFLTVLLSIAVSPSLDNDEVEDSIATIRGGPCERSIATLVQAGHSGAEWAAGLAFAKFRHEMNGSSQVPCMTFDDFAAWYTAEGYSSIPWLELLDLQKWVLN